MLLILRFCLISLSLQIILAKYLRGDTDIGFEPAINTNVSIDLDEKTDIEGWLHSLGYKIDKKTQLHSGSFNTVKFYEDEIKHNKVVLRESIEPIYGADKVWFNKEINQTHLLSTIGVAPYLYKAGYNYKNQGYMISERYDYTLYEFTKYRKHRKLFYRYETELRYQLHALLQKMIYNASIYNGDMKIENIVIRLRLEDIDVRCIDFDAFYSKTSFDGIHNFEYHYKIDISPKRVTTYRKGWYLLCLIFIEEHLRHYSRISLLKDDIVTLLKESDEEILLAMSYIYYSDFMELIRCGYYDDKNLYKLILDNINTDNADLINILQYSRPTTTVYSNYSQIS